MSTLDKTVEAEARASESFDKDPGLKMTPEELRAEVVQLVEGNNQEVESIAHTPFAAIEADPDSMPEDKAAAAELRDGFLNSAKAAGEQFYNESDGLIQRGSETSPDVPSAQNPEELPQENPDQAERNHDSILEKSTLWNNAGNAFKSEGSAFEIPAKAEIPFAQIAEKTPVGPYSPEVIVKPENSGEIVSPAEEAKIVEDVQKRGQAFEAAQAKPQEAVSAVPPAATVETIVPSVVPPTPESSPKPALSADEQWEKNLKDEGVRFSAEPAPKNEAELIKEIQKEVEVSPERIQARLKEETDERFKATWSSERPEGMKEVDIEHYSGRTQSGYDTLREKMPRAFHGIIDAFEAKSASSRSEKLSVQLAKTEGSFDRLKKEMEPYAEKFADLSNQIKAVRDNKSYSPDQKQIFINRFESRRNNVQSEIKRIQEKQTVLQGKQSWLRDEMEHYERRCEQVVDRLTSKVDEKLAPHIEKADILKGKESDLTGEIEKHDKLLKGYRAQVDSYKGKPHSKRAVKALEKLIAQNQDDLESRQEKLDKIRAKLFPLQGKIASLEIKKGGFENLVKNRADSHEETLLDDDAKEAGTGEKVEAVAVNSSKNEQNEAVSGAGTTPEQGPGTPEQGAEKLVLPLKDFIEDWNEYVSKPKNKDLPKVEFDPKTESDLSDKILTSLKRREGFGSTINEKTFSPELFKGYVREYMNLKHKKMKLDAVEKVGRFKSGFDEFTRRMVADHGQE